jgi:hypothetical protein
MPGLRPLGLGEILDVGIKIYLRHWRALMGCVVCVVLPVQIISVLITLSIAPEQLDFTASSGEGVSADEESTFLAAQLTIGVLQGLTYLLVTGACFKAVADAYLGTQPSARRSLAFGFKRLLGVLGVSVLYGLGVALATIVLVIPGIWLYVAWSLAIPALLFERIRPGAALKRSFALVRGRWWKVFLTLIVGVLLVSFLGGIIQGVLLVLPSLLAEGNDAVAAFSSVFANTLGGVITTPFAAAVVALLYFDQRVRKEGFDLQLLAEGMGAERDPDAPLPEPLIGPEITDEQRAAAPYWPPPPGWTPPEPAAPAPAWQPPSAAPTRPEAPPAGDEAPTRPEAPPAGDEAPTRPEAPPAGDKAPTRPEAPPDTDAGPPPDEPPPPERGWQPPSPPEWPPRSGERGPGGL